MSAQIFAAAMLAAVPAAAPEPPIIVTGERISRPLRQTASSVVVTSEREIEAAGANRVEQILALIPNVQLGSGSRGPAIRGLDTTGPLSALPAFLGGNRPRTTIVVDGRPATYNEFVFGTFPLWDIDRVEVFRSPQTTTQGQNSIAGAIFVDSSEPSSAPEQSARAIAGNFHLRQVSAVASGPLGDAAAFRISGDLRYARTTSKIDDVMRGADPNHQAAGLLRARLAVNPAPDTRLLLTYVHSKSQAPQTVGVSAPFEKRRNRDVTYGIFRVRVDSLTAALRHSIATDLSADVTVSAGDSRARRFAIARFGEALNDGRDWSGEAILRWRPAGPVRALAGLSSANADLKQSIDLSLLSGAIGRFRDRQHGFGAFGELEWAPVPRLSATAGLRYQSDVQKRRGALAATSFTVPVDFTGRFDAWLPKLSLAYDVTPSLRIGGLVQKAYNPGGTTIRVDTLLPDSFAAERLWDYELFARADFAGGRGSLATNIFYYAMRDAQRARTIRVRTPSGLPVGFADLFNVAKARSYGAEAQLRWRASPALSAALSLGLLDTKVLDSPDNRVLEGKRFDRSPRFSATAAIDWQPIEPLRLSAQLRHHSSYFANPENTPSLKIGSATIADARAQYRIGRYALFAQVKNLFDTFALVDLLDDNSGEAEDARTVGIGIEADF